MSLTEIMFQIAGEHPAIEEAKSLIKIRMLRELVSSHREPEIEYDVTAIDAAISAQKDVVNYLLEAPLSNIDGNKVRDLRMIVRMQLGKILPGVGDILN